MRDSHICFSSVKLLVSASIFGIFLLLSACTSKKTPKEFEQLDTYPAIFPDYIGVTIPSNIAPLRFKLLTGADEELVVIKSSREELSVGSTDGSFLIPESEWKDLLEQSKGDSLTVTVYTAQNGKWKQHKPFTWRVALETIDPYLAYRLIEPGYELWNTMGIYQRNLTNFDEEPILTNHKTGRNCMNCHSFNQQSPDTIMFHQRAKNGGTYIVSGDKVEKLDPKFSKDFNGIVYPSWHPSGKFIAYSSNDIRQAFARSHRNRVEVYDLKSDIVFYDVARHELFSDTLLVTKHAYETFPCFAPDGKKLYFCSTRAVKMPDEYEDAHYDLCSIDFDASTRTVGDAIDTLFSASKINKSVSFPRISPDGKQLVFVLSDFGNFSIWHREADLYSLDMTTGKVRPITEINSDETESFHSWSSNSRWMVFSSRRIDGLYTRPYFAYMQPDGSYSKPFVLPQADPSYYQYFMKSYNIPELVKGKVEVDQPAIWKATKGEAIKLKWVD